jgi:serine/threonine-protein kinase RsbW
VKPASIQVESRTERLIVVRDFVSEAARAFGFADEDISKIALAVDEACTNVIKHAYRFDPTKIIHVSVQGGDREFEIRIKDDGVRFNPTQVQRPDMKEYLTHFRRGGLGVYLMKSLMDKVEYSIAPGKANEVRLTKYLPG